MDYEKAQDYFLKAQELDETTVSLNDYFDKLKNKAKPLINPTPLAYLISPS